MNFGFDLDDTLTDTAPVINKYAIKFDIEYLKGTGNLKVLGNSKDYYYFAEALGWNSDEIKRFFDVYYINIIKEVKIKPLVSDTIKKLKNRGDKVYIITARRKRETDIIENITRNWLLDNKIEYDELFINIKEKSSLVNELKIDCFIDDSYSNCMDVKKKTNADVFFMQTDYNKNINNIKEFKVIKSISEIL